MQLGRMTPMRVKVAEEADILLANHIYIAPGEANLTCRRRSRGRTSIALDNRREPFASLPAVDPMSASMAEVFGAGAVAVVITGMGRLGTAGARRSGEAGGRVGGHVGERGVCWRTEERSDGKASGDTGKI